MDGSARCSRSERDFIRSSPGATTSSSTARSSACGARRSRRRFDEIVEFSGVSQFIDTPVKRYSSGMYLRLAFAVAAHLDSEILVVDEVLAVGDASFQKKCLAKMEDVGQQRPHRGVRVAQHDGRHAAVSADDSARRGRSRGGWQADREIVGSYLRSGLGTTAHARVDWISRARARKRHRAAASSARSNGDGRDLGGHGHSEAGSHRDEFDVLEAGHALVPNFHFFNEEGVCVFIAGDHDPDWQRRARPLGRYTTTAWIPGNFLSEGTIVVSAAISTMDPVTVHFFERRCRRVSGDRQPRRRLGAWRITRVPFPGVVRPLLKWSTTHEPIAHEHLAMSVHS